MYKGTRHTRANWSYKGTSALSPNFGSEEECRALLAKCREVFISRRLLDELDFHQLAITKGKPTLTAVFGARIRNARRTLDDKRVPERVVFALPAYLFMAPKFGGLLARISRRERGEMPDELKDLHAFLKAQALEPVVPTTRTLIHVTKDGKRTPFTTSAPPVGHGRRRRPASVTVAPASGEPEKQKASRQVSDAGPSALALALQTALSLQQQKKRSEPER
ncbi:hypothetical protein [Paraburkholderia sp. GAS448]|uniref:hypothetical protein n=1 Tax=Paraburkholderia sp. GAS448 TaxID=3035136 RepID=UPI003D20044F